MVAEVMCCGKIWVEGACQSIFEGFVRLHHLNRLSEVASSFSTRNMRECTRCSTSMLMIPHPCTQNYGVLIRCARFNGLDRHFLT